MRGLHGRSYDLLSPYNIDLQVERNGDRFLFYLLTRRSSINPTVANEVFSFSDKSTWRNPDQPVIQINMPYCFFSDEGVALTQVSLLSGPAFGDGIALSSRAAFPSATGYGRCRWRWSSSTSPPG